MNYGAKRAVTHLLRRHQRRQFPRFGLQRCSSTFDKRKWSTPLAKTLAEAIKVRYVLSYGAPAQAQKQPPPPK